MKKALLLIAFILIANFSLAQTLLIFGGKNNNTFLGCLNCNKYDTSSIWNKYGDNGSKYSSNSIWNKYGEYGGKYSSYSPFNKYASNPPVIVDREGNFYGYFTSNQYSNNRTKNKLALFITEYWEIISEDVEKTYDKVF